MTWQHPEWLLLGLPLFALWLFFFWRSRGRWLRLVVLTLLVLALADPRLQGTDNAEQVTLLLDRSLSARGAGLDKGREIGGLLARADSTAEMTVLGFGRSAELLLHPKDPLDSLQSLQPHDESDLYSGLRLVSDLSCQDCAQALLLVSDGLYTGRNPEQLLGQLKKQQLPIYVVPLASPRNVEDTAIVRLQSPSRAARSTVFPVAVEVVSPKQQSGQLRLLDQHGRVLSRNSIRLKTGVNRFALNWMSHQTGMFRYSVDLVVGQDPVPENNLAQLAISIVGPPEILLLNPKGKQTALARALGKSGLRVQVHSANYEISSAALGPFSAVVLENLPLHLLNDGADTALAHYVRHMAGGLLVTGGRLSYAMGGYYHSELEDNLPVILDRETEKRRAKLALGVVMDRSGSMGMQAGRGASKMDLANQSAVSAMKLLQEQDQIAVLAVDTVPHVVAPLSDGNQRQALAQQILAVEAGGGGIFVDVALEATIKELDKSDATSKHILLFTDASDSEQPGDYKNRIANWHSSGHSVSVIALGQAGDSDAAFCRDIAERGGGRIYFTQNALKLPRFFAQDIMHVARDTFVTRETKVQAAKGILALQFNQQQLPEVGGYNITYLAKGAELILQTDDKNRAPLAAAWQRGVGKVMAITFEADGQYTGAFARWAGYDDFFVHAFEWLKRPSQTADAVTDVQLLGRRVQVRLELDQKLAQKLTRAPQALIFPPGEAEPFTLPLHWSGPSSLEASYDLKQNGMYHGVVQIEGQLPVLIPPTVVPYSPEFDPATIARNGEQLLDRLAQATGGHRLTHINDILGQLKTQSRAGRPLTLWIVLLLPLLVLLEIAQRRGLLDRYLLWTASLKSALTAPLRRLSTPSKTEPTTTGGERPKTPHAKSPAVKDRANSSAAESPPAKSPPVKSPPATSPPAKSPPAKSPPANNLATKRPTSSPKVDQGSEKPSAFELAKQRARNKK